MVVEVPVARVRPDATLSDGVVIEASVVARLLGLKLLRLRAHVTVLPARAEPLVPVTRPAFAQPNGSGSLSDAATLLRHASETMRQLEYE